MPAHFHHIDTDSGLNNKRKLSAYLDGLMHHYLEGIRKVKLDYIFCSDEHLLGINRQFLDHDTFTDIITFDLSERDDEIKGEIYISTDRIRENAQRFKVPYEQELHRVIFHGALHLCGFTDKKPKDKKEMTAQEDVCLNTYLQR